MTFLEQLRTAGCVAVLRSRSADDAHATAHALAGAGIHMIEVTFTVPGAAGVVGRLRAELPPDVLVGCGTVTSAGEVRDAVAAGAQYLVSPGTDAELGRALADSGLPFLAGVLTPGEVLHATRLGASAVKLFPASTVGPAYLTALRGPFPGLEIVPTGGIGAGTAAPWIRADALAVGVGGALAPLDATGEALRQAQRTARALLAEIRAARATATSAPEKNGADR